MKLSFIDTQLLASRFVVGDTVKLPDVNWGKSESSYYGRVTHVHTGIGMIDVETPLGNIRYSADDLVLDNTTDSSHLIDTSYPSYEKSLNKDDGSFNFARPRQAFIAFKYAKDRLTGLIKTASKLSSEMSDLDAYNKMFHEHSSSFSDDEIKTAVKVAYDKTALYWSDKGRKYRPTSLEKESGSFLCPKCKTALVKTNYKKHTCLYGCPNCMFLIKPSDLLDGSQTLPDPLLEDPTEVEFFKPNDAVWNSVKAALSNRTKK